MRAIGTLTRVDDPDTGTYRSAAGASYDMGSDTWTSVLGQSITSPALKAMALEVLDTQGPRALYDGARAAGVSLDDLDTITGWPTGTAADWARQNNLPAFAAGGWHSGGMALVGERGPELIVAPPARVISNADMGNVVDLTPLLAEMRSLRSDVQALLLPAQRTATTLDDAARGRKPLITEVAA